MITTETSKTKLVVNVHAPLLLLMQLKFEATFLKRDAYLNNALRIEAEYLRKEIATPNSDMAKTFITKQLTALKLKPLNLLLSTETVDLINDVCKEKNITRDSFINRFFLLLTASDIVLDACFSEFLKIGNAETISDYIRTFSIDDFDSMIYLQFIPYYNSNVIDSIEEFVTQHPPFIRIRAILNHIIDNCDDEKMRHYRSAMYLFPFSKMALQKLPPDYKILEVDNSLGFNPFMTDKEIDLQELDDLLDIIVDKEQRKKDEVSKLMQKEKQARAEKATQVRSKKMQIKSEGEAKNE
jgi:hypothetical protein